MDTILKVLTAGYTGGELLVFFIFFLLGAAISALTDGLARSQSSDRTPEGWSWRFWLKDNWKRILRTLLIVYAEFILYTEITGNPLTIVTCITFGMIGDGASVLLREVKKRALPLSK